ncbi:methylase involved in ubiquinone/menaquinone biosynthesis [Rubidibacter lacunae KORDI 51-2]|uniref:Methylase involved in ubiquinone/menaquinone biosynthesis n=1 Tax=Rubidibacter lacunae KORDI 51-2 TaxID=582515 RepID=U5DGE2_9CHRO|nr:class I SAM-dependent methyltransferase [Rubidibacter lacunae]ERN40656.1 methylase involved in ubiquinone/menaquinone biosynthesis [Rubidibacter lacunae KORDI 51-2]
MPVPTTDRSLSQALQQIAAVFDIDALLQQHHDRQSRSAQSQTIDPISEPIASGAALKQEIVRYYQQSEIGYRKYHSQQGSIHMAIDDGTRYEPSGYYTQPKQVAEHVRALQARSVLEVGCGKGFNSRFLAQTFPDVQFLGLDLTPLHVRLASRAARLYENLQFRLGDFNQTGLAANGTDLVFGVDCLCHAASVSAVLTELYRVLRPGGRLTIFDGFRRPGFDRQTSDLQTASQLVEIGMAVPMGFRTVEAWLEAARSLGFTAVETRDRTAGILPTLDRLQALALRFFKHPWRARLLKFWMPPYLIRNSVAGLLMPYTCTLDSGTHSYYQLVLEKSAAPSDR